MVSMNDVKILNLSYGNFVALDDYMKLQKENQQLKEQFLEETKNNYKLKDELEKKRKEYQETYKDVREEIKDYKKQLKQRDEVIDEAINKLGRYADEMTNNGNAYAICVDLLDTLKKIQRR